MLPGVPAGASSDAKALFLVAKPKVDAPYFERSVVLVARHGRDAAIGLILNLPTDIPLSRLSGADDVASRSDQPLYLGGPVDRQRTVFLRRSPYPLPHSLHLGDDIYMSENSRVLKEALAAGVPANELRVFKGFSGWAPGQLENEIERGDWLVLPVDPDLVFADPEGLWERLMMQNHDGRWVEWRSQSVQSG
jgi:putative transcriptional regulator